MIDNRLLKQIQKLDRKELRELYNHIGELLPPAVTYQLKSVRCGKSNCKRCESGEGHPGYWYAYFTYKNKTYSAYVGKEKKEIDPYEVLRNKGVID